MPVPLVASAGAGAGRPHGVGAAWPAGGAAGAVGAAPGVSLPRCTMPTASFSLPMSTLTIWRSTPGSALTFFTSASVM